MGIIPRLKKEKHGMTGTPEHQAWLSMRRRCYLPTFKQYQDYGGRGITVCDEWLESFSAFYRDVGKRPSDNHTLDRKDSNGNYEPSNVRWVTWDVQSMNKRIRNDNSSGYKGVCAKRSKWRARIKDISLGSFDTKEEAANMYDCFVLQLYGVDAITNFEYR